MSESLRTADGRKITYRRLGDGPPLVCHPGGPGLSGGSLGDLGGVAADFELVLVNPRGTAGSDPPTDPRAYELGDYAADVDALRAHLGLERLLLLGHSHGGFVAMVFAATYPERLDRLVLVGTLPRFSDELRAARAATVASHAGEAWFEESRAALERRQSERYESDEELAALLRLEYRFHFARVGEREEAFLDALANDLPHGRALHHFNHEIAPTFDLRAELGRIPVPTLVLVGNRDPAYGRPSNEIADGIRGAELVVLPGAGHFPWVEEPARFRREVRRFLSP